jgi:hypothetical protein
LDPNASNLWRYIGLGMVDRLRASSAMLVIKSSGYP